MTVGSLAGAGSLTLNGGSLTTGGNNSDTTFSGVIQDGGNGGNGGLDQGWHRYFDPVW